MAALVNCGNSVARMQQSRVVSWIETGAVRSCDFLDGKIKAAMSPRLVGGATLCLHIVFDTLPRRRSSCADGATPQNAYRFKTPSAIRHTLRPRKAPNVSAQLPSRDRFGQRAAGPADAAQGSRFARSAPPAVGLNRRQLAQRWTAMRRWLGASAARSTDQRISACVAADKLAPLSRLSLPRHGS